MPKQKKVRVSKPTLNQIRVMENVHAMVRKGEAVSIGKAMRGIYAPSMTDHPEKVTRSKGWQELMEKNFPDSVLAKRHRELLDKRDKIVVKEYEDGKVVGEEVIDKGPETQAVTKALDMAYQLKGKYAPAKVQSTVVGIIAHIYGKADE